MDYVHSSFSPHLPTSKSEVRILARVNMNARTGSVFDDMSAHRTLTLFHRLQSGTTAVSLMSGEDTSRVNTGFSHMAAAMMAMDHFNARDTVIVPELAQEVFQQCHVKFDTSSDGFKVFDTGSTGHMASRSFFREGKIPCAIAGSFDDMPNNDLGVYATAAEFPFVSNRAYDVRLTDPELYPFTSSVFPSLLEFATTLQTFLLYKGRTDFISFVYTLSDMGAQRREGISYYLDKGGIRWESHPFLITDDGPRQVRSVLQAVKDSGYRTIVVALDNPFMEIPLLAAAAEELSLNNGDYFWIWFATFDPSFIYRRNDDVILKLLAGSAHFLPLETWWTDDGTDTNSFYTAWQGLDAAFVDRVNAANPIPAGQPGYVPANSTYFNDVPPEYGSGFLYDAVMSIGMGACLKHQNNVSLLSGDSHQKGIRQVNFTGSSGQIQFGADYSLDGSRYEGSSVWGAVSLFPPKQDGETVPFELCDVFLPGRIKWEATAPFVYADGRTQAPELLRGTPEQNYLSPALRGVGLGLMSFAMLLAVTTVVWVFIHREDRIVKASQPSFLYILAFGTIVSAFSIYTISFDESYGWSTARLSGACMASAWLLALGHIITFGSLFCKLWRVNRVLQFVRRKIKIRHVAWPLCAMILVALILLSLWTWFASLEYQRIEVDKVTGETIGRCGGTALAAFISPLAVLLAIPTAMTGFMAYKTKDIDESYSESKWIFVLMLVQIEVVLVSAPLMIILRDVSTNGRYLGGVLMMWTFPMSTLLLIMIPKVAAHYGRDDLGGSSIRGHVGAGGIHILV
jgi:hypothetical protein